MKSGNATRPICSTLWLPDLGDGVDERTNPNLPPVTAFRWLA